MKKELEYRGKSKNFPNFFGFSGFLSKKPNWYFADNRSYKNRRRLVEYLMKEFKPLAPGKSIETQVGTKNTQFLEPSDHRNFEPRIKKMISNQKTTLCKQFFRLETLME